MTSASGKSRAVKDPARCSRAVNMTVTAAPVANGQSWVLREKGSPRSKKTTRRVEAAGQGGLIGVTSLAQEGRSGEAWPEKEATDLSAGLRRRKRARQPAEPTKARPSQV